MERVTQWFGTGDNRIAGMAPEHEEKRTVDELICLLLDALARYEDTDLTPDQIEALQEENARLTTPDTVRINRLERIAKQVDDHGGIDHLVGLDDLAYKGRLLVLPCPIGGTVWQRYMQCNPDWVPDRCDDWRPPEAPRGCNGCPHRYANVTPVTFTYSMIRDFGKFYFATKEEALTGGDGNE